MKKPESQQLTEEPLDCADAEERCREECPVKTLTGLIREADVALRAIMPEEFWQHRRAARREALLALRSLLDAAIEHVDKEPAARSRRHATKISIA